MDVYAALSAIPAASKGNIVAIGNFDGVHKGHRALIAAGKKMAEAKGLRFAVLTFEPHPRKLFRPDDPPFRITPPALKYRLLEEAGSRVVEVAFEDPAIAIDVDTPEALKALRS